MRRLASVDRAWLRALVEGAGLALVRVPVGQPIPHSYWGAPEAGLTAQALYVAADTPLHSVLHELGHYLLAPPARRLTLATDAGGDDAEEQAVCLAQVLLADGIAGYGRDALFIEMDEWGYGFREGSARAWFHGDGRRAHATLARPHVRAQFRYLASQALTVSCHRTLLAGLSTQ